MVMGAVHQRVLGYLGRALSLEFSAVQQYMTQASLVEIWGDSDSAALFRRETVEEMQHAERLVQRMLALGMAPAASQLRPVSHAADLGGLLRLDIALKNDLIHHYAEAVRFCVLIGDGDNEALFKSLWNDEQHHGEDLGAWLRSLGSSPNPSRERATF